MYRYLQHDPGLLSDLGLCEGRREHLSGELQFPRLFPFELEADLHVANSPFQNEPSGLEIIFVVLNLAACIPVLMSVGIFS